LVKPNAKIYCTEETSEAKICRSSSRFAIVVPKLVRAVAQIKVAIISYHRQYFAVIAHNTKQHCGFGSALHPKKSHIIPRGVISPSLGTTDLQRATYL